MLFRWKLESTNNKFTELRNMEYVQWLSHFLDTASLESLVGRSVFYLRTTREIWLDLEERFFGLLVLNCTLFNTNSVISIKKRMKRFQASLLKSSFYGINLMDWIPYLPVYALDEVVLLLRITQDTTKSKANTISDETESEVWSL